jgi:hypothetical protein
MDDMLIAGDDQKYIAFVKKKAYGAIQDVRFGVSELLPRN